MMDFFSFAFPTPPPKENTIIESPGTYPHDCGYCHHGTSYSYGFLSNQMLISDYEYLMCHGWRRSGTYFYKTLNYKTCCPAYSIRLKVSDFQISHSQKKVLRKSGNQITVTIEKASFTEEKYELYRNYQIHIHKDKPEDISPEGFTRFLITSPLIDNISKTKATSSTSTSSLEYGTYHHLYRMNGQLVAVGVVDLVPSGLSSVYCFYDPQQPKLVLGKYTALQEIQYCQQYPLDYYYLGLYMHTCVKMKYKAEYKPSLLLCPTTYQWIPIEQCIPLLDQTMFTPLVEPWISQRQQIPQENAEENTTNTTNTATKTEDNQHQLLLKQFMVYSYTPEDLDNIKLDFGYERYFKISDLTTQGQELLQPILSELLQYCDQSFVQHIVVKLG